MLVSASTTAPAAAPEIEALMLGRPYHEDLEAWLVKSRLLFAARRPFSAAADQRRGGRVAKLGEVEWGRGSWTRGRRGVVRFYRLFSGPVCQPPGRACRRRKGGCPARR